VLYTLGLVAVGFLAIPTLAGSAAYAFAETFHWKQGLDEKPQSAKRFYLVVVLATALGVGFDFMGFNPIKALVWSGVVNGILAPFLLIGIVLVASDKRLMVGQPSYRLSRAIVWLTALLMFAAAAAMFLL
jgi:Mn2+/Fe2+ NRAMP family transporter